MGAGAGRGVNAKKWGEKISPRIVRKVLAYTFIYTVHNIAGYFTKGTIDPILSSRIDVVNEVCFPGSGISIPFGIIASA